MSHTPWLSSAAPSSTAGGLPPPTRLSSGTGTLFQRVWSRLEGCQHDPRIAEIRERIAFQVWSRSEQGRNPVTRWMNCPADEEGAARLPLCAADAEALFSECTNGHEDSEVQIVRGWLASSCRWMAADRAADLLRERDELRPPHLEIVDLDHQPPALREATAHEASGASCSTPSAGPSQARTTAKNSAVSGRLLPRPESVAQVLDGLSQINPGDRECLKRSLKELGSLWHRSPPGVEQVADVMRQFSHRPDLLFPLLGLMLEALPGAISQTLPNIWSCAKHRFSLPQQRPLLELLAEQMLRHRPPVALLNDIADWVDPAATPHDLVDRLLRAGAWRADWLESYQDRPLTSACLESLRTAWSQGRMSAAERDRLLAIAVMQGAQSLSGATQSVLALLSWNNSRGIWDLEGLCAAFELLSKTSASVQACHQSCWERKLFPLQLEVYLLQEIAKSSSWREGLFLTRGCLGGFLASQAWVHALQQAGLDERGSLSRLFLEAAQLAGGEEPQLETMARQFADLFCRHATHLPDVMEHLVACKQTFRLELLTALLTRSLRLTSQATAALWRTAFQCLSAEELDSLLHNDTRRVAADWFGAEGSPFRGRLLSAWQGRLRGQEGVAAAAEPRLHRLPSLVETLVYATGKTLEAKRRGQHSVCWPSALVGPMVSYGQRPDQTAELLILLLLATEDLQHHTWCGTSLDKKAPPLLRDLVADLQRSAVPSALLQEIASRFGGFDWRRMQPAELERCQLAVRHFAMGVCRKVFDSLLEASQPMAGSSAGPDRKVDESTLLLAIRNLGDLQTLLVSLGELGRAVIPALLESLGRAETVAPDLLQRRLLEILFRDRVLEWSRLTRRGGRELFSVWHANLDQAFLAPAELPLLWSGAVDWVLAQPEEEIASCASQALSWLGDFRLPLVEDREGVRLMIDAMERLMPPVVEMARRLVDTIARERLVASLSSGLLALPLGLLDRQYGEQIAAEICGYCRRVLEMGLPRADLPVQDLQATVTLLEARLGVLTMDAPDDPRSYLRLWGWEEPGDEAEKGSSAVMQLSLLQQACLDYAHDPHPRSRALLVAIFARALVVSVGSSMRFGDPMGLLPRDSGSRFALLADALSLLNSRQSLVGVWKAIHPRAKHFLTTIDRVPLPQLQELATRILKECGGEPWTLARSLLLSLFSPLQGGSDGVIQVAGSHAKVFLTAELVRSLEDEALNRSLAQWLSQPIPLAHSKIASWMALIVIAARRKQKERE